MIKRLPKLRGRGVNSHKSIQTKPVILHVSDLKAFKAGERVSPKSLVDKGIIKTMSGKYPRVKILSSAGGTAATKEVAAVTIRDCELSAGVKAQIEKAGGKIEA
jgi:ribosomal protein L15